MGKDLGREKEVALLEPQLPPEPSILVFLTILSSKLLVTCAADRWEGRISD